MNDGFSNNKHIYPMPPLFERQGLGTAVMSYDGRLCRCILADRDVVPDLGLLVHGVDVAFRELRGAAVVAITSQR